MSYRISVVILRHHSDAEYIGRPSPLGNPVPIGQGHNRNSVCDTYDTYFHDAISRQDPLILAELKRLHRKGCNTGHLKLGCYCAPRRCHGDTIKKWMENNFDFLEVICDL